jgi:G3E family GTPase
MLLDGEFGRDWRDGEERRNKLVFIGRDLDRDELERGFAACLATAGAVA